MNEPAAAAAGLRFAPGVIHRTSKRGLVIANRHGETVLFEHPRAARLPMLLAGTPTQDELAKRLGPRWSRASSANYWPPSSSSRPRTAR